MSCLTGMDGWQVKEDTTFGPSAVGCGGFELIDKALEVIDYALHIDLPLRLSSRID